ncbi:hypothetical protein A3844_25010 [Paenibacillus helianthi]|uniref:CSD domain-containing protein n=1 Tax=Paenibacillus helianthi TaxID=1349432 RepID=A0ABX3EGT9_9BACL|nr:cold shock domain-containing protein [Paenibacillus helianthi]OKP81848.1 hypothetical protein A3844_25010 [Paenibacillus helianthi]
MFIESKTHNGGPETGESLSQVGPSIATSPRAPKKAGAPRQQLVPGVISSYFPERAFGFIKVRGLRDHFFHISALSDDSDTLYMTVGDRVEIEVGTDKNGRPCATFIKLVG